MSPLEAYGALGLEVGASPRAIRLSFMKFAREQGHPDVGGDLETWNYMSAAKEAATADAYKARCLVCSGTGRKSLGATTFAMLRVVCGDCSGTGKRYQKGD